MKVPFFDLKTQNQQLKSELLETFEAVLDQGEFIYGNFVQQFEKEFAHSVGVNNCIGVSNGADALYVSLKTLGISKGDEVITTAHSWISTADAIARTGAEPIFVDTNQYHLIDETLIESKITNKTKAILPVHLYGQLADVVTIKSICDKHHLFMVEDGAQAHGATFKSIQAGATGNINAFSFYPTKNLGAYGDAGAIVTQSSELAERARMISNNGLSQQKVPQEIGINSRMDSLQAAFLSLKLKKLAAWNSRRVEIANSYIEQLSTIEQITLPKTRLGNSHVYHVFAIETLQREQLSDFLKSKNIDTALHYTYLLPFTKNYAYQNNNENDFPTTVSKSSKLLSLPMYPELTGDQIFVVCESIRSFFNQ